MYALRMVPAPAPAVADSSWEMANFSNIFKVHISIKYKTKYSIKKFSRAIVHMHLNSSENILVGSVL